MHNIEHYTYDENINRDYVQRELDHHAAMEAYQEGAKGLDKKIRWLENLPVCAGIDEAEEVIKRNDKGWYDQLAVRYYEPVPSAKPTKTLQALKERVNKSYNRFSVLDHAVYPQSVSSESVGCKRCGSRLSKKYLNQNFCPLCRADLRPKTKLDAIRAAKEKWNQAEGALKDYIAAHSEKRVKWLVKIEYHT